MALQPLVGGLPSGLTHSDKLLYGADVNYSGTIVNGLSRIRHMTLGLLAWWDNENMTALFNKRARKFISEMVMKLFFFTCRCLSLRFRELLTNGSLAPVFGWTLWLKLTGNIQFSRALS